MTLDISYIGLEPASRTLDVAPGAANVADVSLGSAADFGGAIVVTGTILDSAARALNQQRTADNTTNIVSSDSIGRFPDTNIAEALQRVPGIGVERDQGEGNFISLRGAPAEFTSITVDGVSLPSTSPDTRAVDLGTIPSDVVNSLEVSKTLLPYQDADSIAGAVNLVTRSPFDNPRLRVTAWGGASYNEYGDTSDQRLSGVVSDVFGNVGALLSASYSQTDRRVDNVESFWNVIERPEGDEILGVPEQEFKDYDTRRERLALTGALEFRPSALHRFHLRGTYSRRIDDEYRNLLGLVYEEGALQPGATEATATWNRARFIKEFRHRILRDETLSLSAGGEHELPGARIDYTGSYTEAEQTYPRRQQLVYRSSLRPNLSYDFSADPDLPAISIFETGEHLNLGAYDFRQTTVRSQDTKQTEYALAANVEIPTFLFGNAASYRFGGRIRSRDVVSDEENYRDRRPESAPDTPLVDLL
ncbi:MAG: TonB-dependent receptor plug domain-containing protein, partial [Allosphingosinicella sp.]